MTRFGLVIDDDFNVMNKSPKLSLLIIIKAKIIKLNTETLDNNLHIVGIYYDYNTRYNFYNIYIII